jgi:hypothetical protein
MKKSVIFCRFFLYGLVNLFREKESALKNFDASFVNANEALKKGDLKNGINIFIQSLAVAGTFSRSLRQAIKALLCALSCHERITKTWFGAPWIKKDINTRDEALRTAWTFIDSINKQLRERGLGWIN